ncbi:MAG: hypothetical protein ACM3OG_09550 [Actinomycetota bacterium]
MRGYLPESQERESVVLVHGLRRTGRETRVEGARPAAVRASHVGPLPSRNVAALLRDHLRKE